MFFKAGKEERGKRRENSGKNPLFHLYLSFKYSVVERLSEFCFENALIFMNPPHYNWIMIALLIKNIRAKRISI